MSNTDQCPRCGAPSLGHPFEDTYDCLYRNGERSDLCREREARQKAEKHLAEIRAERDIEHDACNNYLHILAHRMTKEIIDEYNQLIK